MTNEYTLTLPASGELAQAIDKDQLYVVAIVTNADGSIANAAKAKVGSSDTGIDGVAVDSRTVDVYSLNGTLVKKDATSLKSLPHGIYIVNGKKVVIK